MLSVILVQCRQINGYVKLRVKCWVCHLLISPARMRELSLTFRLVLQYLEYCFNIIKHI